MLHRFRSSGCRPACASSSSSSTRVPVPRARLTKRDDMVVLASEVGVLDIPEAKIVKKWRLQPGKMFLVDIEKGKIIDDGELKRELATAKPYREWGRARAHSS